MKDGVKNMKDQKKILFVCMGNICRSPLAHGIFMHKVKEKGLEKLFSAQSCGTINYHQGKQADARMRANAKSHGIIINHRARHLKKSDLNDYDLILAMDKENLNDIKALHTTDEQLSKIKLFRSYDPDASPGAEVPDPYYGGDDGFEKVFQIVNRTCDHLLNQLLRE
jgi:protein-tyrosine phosphatase